VIVLAISRSCDRQIDLLIATSQIDDRSRDHQLIRSSDHSLVCSNLPVVRCTTARVDLAALESNFKAIGAHLTRESGLNRGAGRGPALAPGIIAVVKANAYGHGARRVAATLEAAGATMLAVADIEEGVDLRRSGVRAPILVFGALSVSTTT
jgi:hypothetical protein